MGMPSTILLLCLQMLMSSRIYISGVFFSCWNDTSQIALGPYVNSLNLITSFKVLFPNIVTFWGLGLGLRYLILWRGDTFQSTTSGQGRIFCPPVLWEHFFHYTKPFFFEIFFWWVQFLKSLLSLLQIASILCFVLFCFWPWGMWDLSSPTKDWTCTPCFGRQSPNHWTTREVPGLCIWLLSVHLSCKIPAYFVLHLSCTHHSFILPQTCLVIYFGTYPGTQWWTELGWRLQGVGAASFCQLQSQNFQ